jgi:hypothetical protein
MIVLNHNYSPVLSPECFLKSGFKTENGYTMLIVQYQSEQSPAIRQSINNGFLRQKPVYPESKKMTLQMFGCLYSLSISTKLV